MRLCTSEYISGFSDVKEQALLVRAQEKWSGKELYHCTKCGKLGYYSADQVVIIPGMVISAPKSPPAKLPEPDPSTPTDINDLLKIHAGESKSTDVIEHIGRPYGVQKLPTGHLLCYYSNDFRHPHSILIDSQKATVKLISIHNDSGAFDLKNLSNAYGECEFITNLKISFREMSGRIQLIPPFSSDRESFGFEDHIGEFAVWIYEAHGVAFFAETDNKNEILYVQFFEKGLNKDQYWAKVCFINETFKSKYVDA